MIYVRVSIAYISSDYFYIKFGKLMITLGIFYLHQWLVTQLDVLVFYCRYILCVVFSSDIFLLISFADYLLRVGPLCTMDCIMAAGWWCEAVPADMWPENIIVYVNVWTVDGPILFTCIFPIVQKRADLGAIINVILRHIFAFVLFLTFIKRVGYAIFKKSCKDRVYVKVV